MSVAKQIVNAPDGSLFYGNGYVYYNTESAYEPTVKYMRNKRLCIGRNIDGKTMYANDNYIALFAKDSLPDSPDRADALMVGLPLMLKWAMSESGLLSDRLFVQVIFVIPSKCMYKNYESCVQRLCAESIY